MKGELKVSHDGTELKVLDELVATLSANDKADESRCRPKLVEAVEAFTKAEVEVRHKAVVVGEQLKPYRAWFGKQKANGSVKNFRRVIEALGLSKSTAYRCETAHWVSTVPGLELAAKAQRIDLLESRSSKLANRIRRERGNPERATLTAVALLDFCIKAMADEVKAGEAPTLAKATGPMPDLGFGLARGTEVLMERFLKSYASDAEEMMRTWLEEKLKGRN